MGFEFRDPRADRKGWKDEEGDVDQPLTPEQERRLEAILYPTSTPSPLSPVIQIRELATGCRVPSKATQGDAGWDLYVSRRAQVLVDGMTDLHTDIAIALPPGYFGRITGRSSTLRKRGLLVNEGIVDEGYRGELFIAVFNLSNSVVTIEPGERLAQLLIHRVEQVKWMPVKELPWSDRGESGFGSSGR